MLQEYRLRKKAEREQMTPEEREIALAKDRERNRRNTANSRARQKDLERIIKQKEEMSNNVLEAQKHDVEPMAGPSG